MWGCGQNKPIAAAPLYKGSAPGPRTGGILIEVPTRSTKLSQFSHGCGSCLKKPLSQRWHQCACGVGPVQRDLYAAFLPAYLDPDHLPPRVPSMSFPGKARKRACGPHTSRCNSARMKAVLAPKLWPCSSRSASTQQSERSHTRASFSVHAGETGSVEAALSTPVALARGVFRR
jgi:hypothetical protein